MSKYQIILNSVVIDSVVIDQNATEWTYPFAYDEIVESEQGGIGWSYIEGTFLPPISNEPEPE